VGGRGAARGFETRKNTSQTLTNASSNLPLRQLPHPSWRESIKCPRAQSVCVPRAPRRVNVLLVLFPVFFHKNQIAASEWAPVDYYFSGCKAYLDISAVGAVCVLRLTKNTVPKNHVFSKCLIKTLGSLGPPDRPDKSIEFPNFSSI